jgi:hypothetical protein
VGRGRGRSQRGFGAGGDAVARGTGAAGGEKRRLLNQISGIMVLSAGVAGAFFGFVMLGVAGAVIGFVAFAGLMGKFVVGGRYYR